MHKLLLVLFLLPISATYAMQDLLKDTAIITYNLAPQLDRDDRMSFKRTNKSIYAIIIPQHILNEEYRLACQANDKSLINELRRKGALHPYEEAYALFLHNKESLIAKAVPLNHKDVSAVFLYCIEKNNVPFMKCLLNTKKPPFESLLIDRVLESSTKLNHDPMTELLRAYVLTQRGQYIREMEKNAIAMPEPTHAMVRTKQFKPTQSKTSSKNKCIIS